MDFLAASRAKVTTHTTKEPMNAINSINTKKEASSEQGRDQTVRSLNEGFEGRYRSLHQEYTALQVQHRRLREQLTAMTDTVRVLGEQPTPLLERHAKLQEQCKDLKNSVQTLNRSFEAANEKLFLQNQLHENKLRTMEATHNTLKERCKTMAVATEQHRLGNLQLEVRNKSMAKDIEKIAELHACAIMAKDGEANALQARLSKAESDFAQLRIAHARLESEEVPPLQAKIKAAEALLRSHPINAAQGAKTKSIISSSAEILELAHAKGSAEEMKQCLGQVAAVLKDLNGQLGVQCRLSKAWMDQVDARLD
jgi:type II secretory pathway component PulJ